MIVIHNMMAQNAQKNRKIVDGAKTKAMERLSSGYRVNRAADDAAGLSVSEEMRAQIRGLNRASSNIREGISLTNVADGALHEIHALLQRERELMVQAANDTYCEEDREAIEQEVEALTSELDRMFDEAEYNTIKIFQGHDTILQGPDTDVQTITKPDIENKNETLKKTVIWISKEEIAQNGEPQDVVDNTTTVTKQYYSTYEEQETVLPDSDDPQHPSYQKTENYTLGTVTTTTVSEISTKYQKLDTDPRYTTLQEPGKMVSSNGYINVQNVARNLSLSCAMSQLGISVDGVALDVDLYYSNNNTLTRSTVVSDDNMTATTTYQFHDAGIELDQIISLTDNGESYTISYQVRNTDAAQHDITLRLAFDVMNLDKTHAAQTTDGVGGLPYILENDDAVITVTAQGVSDACLTDISDLYNVMDKSKVNLNKTGITHTGAGFWWNQTIDAGDSANFGPVKYGPITLKKIPYEKQESTKDNITISEEIVTTTTETEYKPQYLDIQEGANAFQMMSLRLWDLSAENLKCRVPTEVSAFNAQNSLRHLDRVIDKVSSIRAYYGAMTNRMEHAYLNNDNTAENVTTAESRIRDADMADEMILFHKNSILQQAGQSVLAQANMATQGILGLLQ